MATGVRVRLPERTDGAPRPICDIAFGDSLRKRFKEDAFLAYTVIACASQHGRFRLTRAAAREAHGFAVKGIEPLLAAPLKRRLRSDKDSVLENADFVSENMDVEHTPARRVGHAVENAADADHAFVRGAPFQPHDGPRTWQSVVGPV
jgi:hypothetical protein